jgi:hypothetical protein
MAMTVTGEMKAEVHQRFGSGAPLGAMFTPFGPGLAQSLKPQPDGLLIELTGGSGGQGPVGIAANFDVVGDFEITLGYQLVEAAPPTTGTGAGVKIWGQIGGPDGQKVSLARLLRTGNRNNAVLTFKRGGQEGKLVYQAHEAEQPHGRLRIVRTGEEMSFQYADGDSTQFHEIRKVEKVRREPLEGLRLTAATGGDAAPLTVKLLDLHIRSGKIGRKEQLAARSHIWIAVAAVCVIVVIAGGALAVGRFRRRAATDGPSGEKTNTSFMP